MKGCHRPGYMLALHRMAARLSLFDAAKLSGFNYETIRKWEKGQSMPSLTKAACLCELYRAHGASGATLDSLMYTHLV